MISFDTSGIGWVRFQIDNAGEHRRSEVKMRLSDYLALVRVSVSLEDLRVLVLSHREKGRQKAKAAAV